MKVTDIRNMTAEELNAKLAELTDLSSSGKFSQSKNKYNLFVDIICNGYTQGLGTDAESVAAKVAAKVSAGGMGGDTYLAYKNDAWERLVEYYESLN